MELTEKEIIRRCKISETLTNKYASGERKSSPLNTNWRDPLNRGKKISSSMKSQYLNGKRKLHLKVWVKGQHPSPDTEFKKGHPCLRGKGLGLGKTGIRNDLGNTYFRSTYESNYARILNYLGIIWEYEPCRFVFDDCSYCPDFYLPQLDVWVECKGYLTDDGRHRLEKFHKEYPSEDIRILDGESHKKFREMYANNIPNWEK